MAKYKEGRMAKTEPMRKWHIYGYYPVLNLPYGCFVGANSVEEAVESVLKNIHKNWPPERQVIIAGAVEGLGGYEFGGLLSSRRGTTIKSAKLPESRLCLRRRHEAGVRLKKLGKTLLKPIAK